MTRFTITIQQSVDFVLQCLERMQSGEIFVPKIPSYRIVDVAEAIAPGKPYTLVGVRPGEKLHEEMITRNDAYNTLEFTDYFVILPTISLWDEKRYATTFGGRRCIKDFYYSSEANDHWLTVEDLKRLIYENRNLFT
jgi:FlaA1/EpsC-like NDP-sugar epimerase